jgi:hypothetical protein
MYSNATLCQNFEAIGEELSEIQDFEQTNVYIDNKESQHKILYALTLCVSIFACICYLSYGVLPCIPVHFIIVSISYNGYAVPLISLL